MEGFPEKAPGFVRKTIGPLILKRTLETGRWPNGIRLPRKYEPKPKGGARAEAEALLAALQPLASHPGPLADHPFSGPQPFTGRGCQTYREIEVMGAPSIRCGMCRFSIFRKSSIDPRYSLRLKPPGMASIRI